MTLYRLFANNPRCDHAACTADVLVLCCVALAVMSSRVDLRAGDEALAERAATKIKKFFLDEETGMLPSLLYAQMKPGYSKVGAPTVRVGTTSTVPAVAAVLILLPHPSYVPCIMSFLFKFNSNCDQKVTAMTPKMCRAPLT
jgi:hypothetical protein